MHGVGVRVGPKPHGTHPRNRQSSQEWHYSTFAPNCKIFPQKIGPEITCFPTQIARVFVYMPLLGPEHAALPHDRQFWLKRPLDPLCPQTHLVWEGFKACSHRVSTAKFGGLKAADDILEGSSHHKVLLFQPQLLAFKELQVGGPHWSVLQLPSPVRSQPLEMLLSTLMGFPTGLTGSAPHQGKCGYFSYCL